MIKNNLYKFAKFVFSINDPGSVSRQAAGNK